MKRIALFVSGSGSNAENIANYFKDSRDVCVDSIWSSSSAAFALERAKRLDIPSFVLSRNEFRNSDKILSKLQTRNVDLIVLAGFLWLIPSNLIRSFKIVNIHPALLPKYGGKGMYGMNVHRAVIENGESESGITIHLVNEKYDDGKILCQEKCVVNNEDTPTDLANKIHELEFKFYPQIIEQLLVNDFA